MFGDVPIDASIARLLDNLAFGFILVPGALASGVVMAIVAVQVFRRRAFAQWVGWVSIVGVIAMAASIVFIPLIALPLWLLAVSVELFRTGSREVASAAPAQ
jgi:hypothetical protein